MLDDPAIVSRFASAARLPRDYGIGLDERVVEYPWLLSRGVGGRVLDAGSTLNHAHILDRVLPHVDALHIVTLAPEPTAFVDRGVSYLFADLRELPLRDAQYDVVISLSTLEHVGMDNTQYGGPAARAADPAGEVALACRELLRVARPGARLLVTVPYGRREDHRWFRQFDADDVERFARSLGASRVETVVYAYTARGWQVSDLRAARDASYRDYLADPRPVGDRAAAARAVACLEARL